MKLQCNLRNNYLLLSLSQYIKKFVSLILLKSIPLSCLDTIEVDLPTQDGLKRLVVQGVAERSDKIYLFFVQVLNPGDLQSLPTDEILFADIDLFYNDHSILSLENGSELTIPISTFHDHYGSTPKESNFNIKVSLGDTVFESVSQAIFTPVEDATLKLDYVQREELNEIENVVTNSYVKLLVNTPIVNEDQKSVSFLWNVTGVYLFREVIWTLDTSYDPRFCYVSGPSGKNEINLIKASDISGNSVKDVQIHEAITDHRFASDYYYTVIQKTIDESAADYWTQVQASVDRQGTIYDPPTGIVTTNIIQTEGSPVEVLGYFYTAGVDTLGLLSTGDETGIQPHLCAHKIISDVCCDCILILNSSYSKPSYWQ